MASLLAPALGSQVPRSKKSPRRDAERRCRVPLFSGNPGNKPRPLPRCAFRRSASLFSSRGRFTEPITHAKTFAGSDDAWAEEGNRSIVTNLFWAAARRALTRQMLVYIQILRFLAALAVVAF